MWTEDEIKDLQKHIIYIETLVERVIKGVFIEHEMVIKGAKLDAEIANNL